MKDFGIVESAVQPEPLVIDEISVWVHTDIAPVQRDDFSGFTYHMVQYGKEEYIRQINDRLASANSQITDLQVALCELYEGVN